VSLLTNLWFYFGREFATFSYDVGVFPRENFGLSFQDFKSVSQLKVKHFVVQTITVGKGVGCVALESE
jgi:hypothetical protein